MNSHSPRRRLGNATLGRVLRTCTRSRRIAAPGARAWPASVSRLATQARAGHANPREHPAPDFEPESSKWGLALPGFRHQLSGREGVQGALPGSVQEALSRGSARWWLRPCLRALRRRRLFASARRLGPVGRAVFRRCFIKLASCGAAPVSLAEVAGLAPQFRHQSTCATACVFCGA